MNNDKLTEELPRVRVSEQMLLDLSKAAAAQDRSLSDLIRVVLNGWLYGHARRIDEASEG